MVIAVQVSRQREGNPGHWLTSVSLLVRRGGEGEV